jgi:spore maturation protein CgeB
MNLNIVIFGLSITSSWGNGHASTYRALVKALHQRGHRVTFLERDVPWYRPHRDLTEADYCRIELYESLQDVPLRFGTLVGEADLVIVGSYVPDGAAVGDWATSQARGVTAFYDIDTPVTLARLQAGNAEYLPATLIPRFDLYLSFTGGPVLELIETRYGSPRARPLYCAVDPDIHAPMAARLAYTLGYLGTYSADRQPPLERLLLQPARQLPREQFVVAGAQYPSDILWPANIERVEHLPPRQHPLFYCSQRFTLNITRADMIAAGFSPSVRLFEAAACGVPIISDRWPGLETFFIPGEEILTADSPEHITRILSELSDERRLSIAAAARRRVLQHHTATDRARQLEEYYGEACERAQAKALGRKRARPAVEAVA